MNIKLWNNEETWKNKKFWKRKHKIRKLFNFLHTMLNNSETQNWTDHNTMNTLIQPLLQEWEPGINPSVEILIKKEWNPREWD